MLKYQLRGEKWRMRREAPSVYPAEGACSLRKFLQACITYTYTYARANSCV